MTDVFYLRPMEPPATGEQVLAMAGEAGGCFDMHQVDWKYSYLSPEGDRMLCWYRAPDAESARNALRQLGSDLHAVWPGTLLDEIEAHTAARRTSLLAEFAVVEGQTVDKLYATLAENLGETLLGGFSASNGKQVVCLLSGDDIAEASAALNAAATGLSRIWPCEVLEP